MTPQQSQLAAHGVDQLLRIVRQIEGVFFQHRRQKGNQFVALAVEPSRGHRFHADPRMAREPEPAIGTHGRQALRQLPRTGDPGAAEARGHRQTSLFQSGLNGIALRDQGHQHLCRPQRLAMAALALPPVASMGSSTMMGRPARVAGSLAR